MSCSACKTTEHPREAHSDPALARAAAERLVAAGRPVEAEMWRRVASNLERRMAS